MENVVVTAVIAFIFFLVAILAAWNKEGFFVFFFSALTLWLLSLSAGFLSVEMASQARGFPARAQERGIGQFYGYVDSGQVGEKKFAVLREPEGDLRLFVLYDDDQVTSSPFVHCLAEKEGKMPIGTFLSINLPPLSAEAH